MARRPTVLCLIPARSGSKRIPSKNTKLFQGEPLVGRTIAQALSLGFVDRIVVDTDSKEIARIGKKYGAEVPFLRPKRLATDSAQLSDAVLHVLKKLEVDEGFRSDFILLLQPTSPLRELEDIQKCWKRIKQGDVDAVVTIARTHPQLFVMKKRGLIERANKKIVSSSNMQSWPEGYLLNGCFVYIIKTDVFKREKTFVPRRTAGIVCPRWRSIDLDTKEDWVMAELVHKNRARIERALKK